MASSVLVNLRLRNVRTYKTCTAAMFFKNIPKSSVINLLIPSPGSFYTMEKTVKYPGQLPVRISRTLSSDAPGTLHTPANINSSRSDVIKVI